MQLRENHPKMTNDKNDKIDKIRKNRKNSYREKRYIKFVKTTICVSLLTNFEVYFGERGESFRNLHPEQRKVRSQIAQRCNSIAALVALYTRSIPAL